MATAFPHLSESDGKDGSGSLVTSLFYPNLRLFQQNFLELSSVVSLLGSSMSVLIVKQVQSGWVGQNLDYGQVDQPMLPLEWLNALFFSSSLDVSMMVLRALTVTSKSRSLSFCGIDDWTLY